MVGKERRVRSYILTIVGIVMKKIMFYLVACTEKSTNQLLKHHIQV